MKHAVMTQLSEADYLDDEGASQVRHEYVAGEVFAMAGVSKAHNIISLNLAVLLRNALRGRWVEVYRRAESGWVADLYSPGDTITLNPTTLDTSKLAFGMDDVYEGSGVV